MSDSEWETVNKIAALIERAEAAEADIAKCLENSLGYARAAEADIRALREEQIGRAHV